MAGNKAGHKQGTNIMQEILKQAYEQQHRTMKREALFCNIFTAVLGAFTLSAIVPWFFIG